MKLEVRVDNRTKNRKIDTTSCSFMGDTRFYTVEIDKSLLIHGRSLDIISTSNANLTKTTRRGLDCQWICDKAQIRQREYCRVWLMSDSSSFAEILSATQTLEVNLIDFSDTQLEAQILTWVGSLRTKKLQDESIYLHLVDVTDPPESSRICQNCYSNKINSRLISHPRCIRCK